MLYKTPAKIAEAVEDIGKAKAGMSLPNMFILAILAGVYIGFGGALATLVSHDISTYLGVGISKMIAGAVFTVGLMLIVLCGAELFTGNNLIIIPFMSKKVSAFDLAKNWTVVYIGNFVGALFLVALMAGTGLLETNSNLVGASALNIANGKVNLTFTEAFTRAILCNWLVCLAIWFSIAAEDTIGKIFGIFFPVMAFFALGFEHSVANMYFIPIGILLKEKSAIVTAAGSPDLGNLTWEHFIVDNLIPVTLGNIVGGAIFVGFLYWFVYRRPALSAVD